ncbi:MAG TPA: hypothetical protein VKZ63_18260 [Kofleriaceae bacterium]|nr:hypothetical protein [Kofleriaceae bacterium]
MSRPGFRRLSTAAVAVVFGLTSLWAGDAEAGKKGRKAKAKKAPVTHKINQKALSDLMGPYKFGMTKKQILGILSSQINAKYKDKIAGTTDVYQQDKLRRQRAAELNRIKKSYVEFKGKKTGWDVSIIDDQFAHNTDESMMVHWENSPEGADQRRFFFFHDGRLYKMFIALNTSKLKDSQRKFSFFQSLMESRYGKGSIVKARGLDGTEQPVGIEWNSRTHHVTALDKLQFYGAFCLVVADPGEERQLADLRKAAAPPKKTTTVLDTVIAEEGDDDELSLDDNKAAVDAVLRGN